VFVGQNKSLFLTNNVNHNLDTRQRNNLYLPQANLTLYQGGAYYLGIKIFNNLPSDFTNVADNLKEFKTDLKQLLYTYSFYTLEEYFNQLLIMYCTTKIAVILALVFRFCLMLHCTRGG